METVTETEHRLVDQPRGVQLSYRVRAMNQAGDGPPSAPVTAVLELVVGPSAARC